MRKTAIITGAIAIFLSFASQTSTAQTSAPQMPVINIVTDTEVPEITSKEDYLEGDFTFDGGDDYEAVSQRVQIRGRGNTSWGMPKKPYRLKFDSKVSIAGLTKAKNYVLLACYTDGSLLQYNLATRMAQILGLPYTNHVVNVEVTLNGIYKGVYQLTNKPGINSGSIDVDEDTSVQWEFDTAMDELYNFNGAVFNTPVMVSDPDMTERKFELWQQDYNNFEAMVSEGKADEVAAMDVFARYYAVYNIMRCNEPGHPKSVKLIKSQGLRYVFGPIWDFDWCMGFADATQTGYNEEGIENNIAVCPIFKKMINNSKFKGEYHKALKEIVDHQEDILAYIDSISERIADGAARNNEAWPNTQNWAESFPKMRAYFVKRLALLAEKEIPGYEAGTQTPDPDDGTGAGKDNINFHEGMLSVTPRPGAGLIQEYDRPLQQIKIDFTDPVWIKAKSFKLTDFNGNSVPVTVSGHYNAEDPLFAYRLPDQKPFITVNFSPDDLTESGIYTLTIEPGGIRTGEDKKASSNEETLSYQWGYFADEEHTERASLTGTVPDPATSALSRRVANNVTLIFSKPVKVDTLKSSFVIPADSIKAAVKASRSGESAYDKVWTVALPSLQSLQAASDSTECVLKVYASEDNGNVVGCEGKVPADYEGVEIPFRIASLFNLDYMVDGHNVSLTPVEAESCAEFVFAPAEGWTLDSLTFNGDDVIGDVVENRYITPAITENSVLQADYRYASEVWTPSGVDDVVTDLNLRAWSDGGYIKIAGLKAGEELTVYTVGGSSAVDYSCGEGAPDTVGFQLPEGIYIIVVKETEGPDPKRVAIKLQHTENQ